MTQQKPGKLPLLRSESPTEFLALRTRLNLAVKPQDGIEEVLFDDFVTVVWEMKRESSLKASSISLAFPRGLRNVVERLLMASEVRPPQAKAHSLVRGYFGNDPAAKKEVAALLGRFDLDESDIEAEAGKLTLDQQQHYSRSLAMLSARRDKVLRMIMDYRGSEFAKELRQKSDQIINEPQDRQPLDGGDAAQMAAA